MGHNPTISPALSSEEWEALKPAQPPYEIDFHSGNANVSMPTPDYDWEHLLSTSEPHAVAAICLHGQPFGFDRNDVIHLRECANGASAQADEYGDNPMLGSSRTSLVNACRESAAWFVSLADRIESLLPPVEGHYEPGTRVYGTTDGRTFVQHPGEEPKEIPLPPEEG